MPLHLGRREFLQATVAGSALYFGMRAGATAHAASPIISPGCRRSKVRVAKLYLGIPKAHWPTPTLDLNAEVQRYEEEFSRRAAELADVEFAQTALLTSVEQAQQVRDALKDVDGVLCMHLSMGIMGMLREILAEAKPTILFAAPYSGHEWTQFGALRKESTHLDCMLTSDFDQLAAAIRPFRAIHHLREAKVLNVSAREPVPEYLAAVKEKFGTEIVTLGRQPVLDAYDAVEAEAAENEAKRWLRQARQVVEPSQEEVFRSCRLALAFERLLEQEQATVVTVDCYGSMYRQLPAFPCIGFTRLNDMGLGGICESDLQSALTHILFQGLVGRPGFISDPTVDESKDSIILAHCLGSTRMDGPSGPAAPYKLRTIMERQEGAVPQVKMRLDQKVTQARFVRTDLLLYFTGEIIEAPDHERGCRTKITVKVDGDIKALWENWSHGLHRVTCYGDLTEDLQRFCRFKGIQLVNEAVPAGSQA